MRTQWATGLRVAAASARQALLQMAADRLGVSVERLTTSGGVVSVQGGSRKVSYAQLVGGAQIPGTVDRRARAKPASQYRVVGRSLPREDIPSKVAGTFRYVQDVSLKGMLHGRVVRPMRPAPLAAGGTALAGIVKGTIANGTLESVDESSVRHLPGKVRVVTAKDFLGLGG